MALQRPAPRCPAPTALSSGIWRAAEAGDTPLVLRLLEQEGYPDVDARSIYQSTLLHAAARHGHLELARALLARGADVNALDFGGMRRTPLHWACKGGHVALVELLVAAGADTTADGRSWFKLVQGSRCGSLIPKDSCVESAEALCTTNAVRLALKQPRWEPAIHSMWPQRFRQAARLLLLASQRPARGSGADGDGPGGSGGSRGAPLPLGRDALLEILQRAAYPISAWV